MTGPLVLAIEQGTAGKFAHPRTLLEKFDLEPEEYPRFDRFSELHAIDRQVFVLFQFRTSSFVQSRDIGKFSQAEQQRLRVRRINGRQVDIIVDRLRRNLVDIRLTNPGPIE